MAHRIEVREVKDGKVLIRLNDRVQWWVEPGDMVKVSDPDVNVYRIGKAPDGTRYQGPVSLPEKVEE